ncbi:MAG TPA: response regulator [Verrucomicrobiae bacterium]|jgi:DNA-binding response OmpR family regulator|nr:response regulator [Verrucomicrobiae bacterium]
MKILIIEDDQVVANIYRNKFAIEGFQAETAPDGVVGLELLQTFRPDVVLLDLVLPRVTGIEVMRQLRSQKDFEQVPVIVFSNTYLSNMVQEAWKAGATKCLSKANCTPKQVIEAVRSALKITGAPASAAGKHTAKTSSPPATEAPESSNEADVEFQAQLRRDFIADLPNALTLLRTLLQALFKADNEAARVKQIQELYRRARSLSSNAGIAGAKQIATIADALEALLKELQEKPTNINASTLRTVAAAIDFMATLFERAAAPDRLFPPAEALVVDDEVISRRAITFALDKANLKSTSVEDPLKALDLVAHKKFDLVFLDVDMPNMMGFELCSKIRMLPAYAKTPVVFVTGLNDLESRANSTMSGGNDFIAKPFLFIELTVKALVHVLRSQLNSQKQ